MKLQLQFAEGLRRSALWIKPATLQRALTLFEARVKNEPEWIETEAILGDKPRSVSVLFCGDEMMRDYQRRFRKMDRTTDVLSFPEREIWENSEASNEMRTLNGAHLGDLIVSLETVERAAKRVRRKPAEELLEVMLHGWLHLIGHDHIGSSIKARAAAKRMRGLQRELFRTCRTLLG